MQRLQETEAETRVRSYRCERDTVYHRATPRSDGVVTCAGGGAEALTTGALTAAVVVEVRKSPDRMSRASPVPMDGCRSRR